MAEEAQEVDTAEDKAEDVVRALCIQAVTDSDNFKATSVLNTLAATELEEYWEAAKEKGIDDDPDGEGIVQVLNAICLEAVHNEEEFGPDALHEVLETLDYLEYWDAAAEGDDDDDEDEDEDGDEEGDVESDEDEDDGEDDSDDGDGETV